MSYSIEFQKAFLAASLCDNNSFNTAKSFFKDEYLKLPAHRFIWGLADYTITNSGSLFNDYILKASLDENDVSEDDKKIIIDEYKEICKIRNEVDKTNYSIIYKCKEYSDQFLLEKNEEKLKKLFDQKNYSALRDEYIKLGKQLESISQMSSIKVIDWHESFEDRLKIRRQQIESGIIPISTGFQELDTLMEGGYLEKEMFVIAAPTNLGKSALAVQLAGVNIDNGIGGIGFLTEMDVYEMSTRFDARHNYVDFSKFKNFKFSESDLKSLARYNKQNADKYNGLLKLVSTESGMQSSDTVGVTLEVIRQTIRQQRHKIKNFRYIFIDSGNQVVVEERFAKQYEAHEAIAKGICSILRDENLAGIVTLHSNRDGANKTTNENIGGSYTYSQRANWVLGIEKEEYTPAPTIKSDIPDSEEYFGGIEELVETAEENEFDQRFKLTLTKARAGSKGDVKVSANLRRMIYNSCGNPNDVRLSVLR